MPTEIDAFEFTRAARSAEGRVPVSQLSRLVTLLAETGSELSWRLDGWRENDAAGAPRMRLRLRVSGSVAMSCGRCLGVAQCPLAIDRGFLLVATEAQAEALDQDDEELDALVASRRFDMDGLIEDETILALPPAPTHSECKPPAMKLAQLQEESSAPPRRPLAALATLRKKPAP